MAKHKQEKTSRPVRVPAPYDQEAIRLALHTTASVNEAEGLLGVAQGDGDMAAYGCDMIRRGWPYSEARAVVLWMTATGTRPPCRAPRLDAGRLIVTVRADAREATERMAAIGQALRIMADELEKPAKLGAQVAEFVAGLWFYWMNVWEALKDGNPWAWGALVFMITLAALAAGG